MAVLYTATSVSGYNANPPPDDGTTVSTNLITWSGIKTKVGDPLNTFAGSVDSNITAAFGKTLDGATVVATGVNYAATAADQGRLIKATASGITVTTPDATVVTAPFSMAVNNQSAGTITVAGFSAQTIDGTNTQVIQPGSGCILKTDGTNWFTYGLKAAQNTTTGSTYGFTEPVNLQLSCSVASNLLTVAVKTKAGNDPSVGDPVLIPFRDTTNANGDPVWVTISSALSINTNGAGASLASQNSKPFRFWIVAFNNAGTAVLALWHSGAGASTIAINPLNEGTLQSTTAISAAATSAGVFYTPNGTTLSSKAFRIIGYLEYTSGLATAGTYTAAPDIVQLFGPGISKPGQTLQTLWVTRSSADTTTSTTLTTTGAGLSQAITPTSAANLVRARITTNASNATAGDGASIGVIRTATGIGVQNGVANNGGNANIAMALSVEAIDAPNTTSATTYFCGIRAIGGGTATFHVATGLTTTGGSLTLDEIMA